MSLSVKIKTNSCKIDLSDTNTVSQLAIKVATVGADTTLSGRLFNGWTTLLEYKWRATCVLEYL